MKRKLGCIFYLGLISSAVFALFYYGVIDFEFFQIKGQVLETTKPNIYYVYTSLGTNEYGQIGENYEIINKKFQTDGTILMTTIPLKGFPAPNQTVAYARAKLFIRWPIHRVIWFNFTW